MHIPSYSRFRFHYLHVKAFFEKCSPDVFHSFTACVKNVYSLYLDVILQKTGRRLRHLKAMRTPRHIIYDCAWTTEWERRKREDNPTMLLHYVWIATTHTRTYASAFSLVVFSLCSSMSLCITYYESC